MNNMNTTNLIAEQVKQGPVAGPVVNGAVAAMDAKSTLEAELARLRTENAALKGKPKAGVQPGKSETPKPAPVQTNGLPAADVNKPCGGLGYPEAANTQDRIILDLIHQFKSKDREDGKTPGTFAVKIHGYLHLAGVPEVTVRSAVESASKRGLITRMSIPTKHGNRMMLLFDAREKKPYEINDKNLPSAEVKTAIAAAFGL